MVREGDLPSCQYRLDEKRVPFDFVLRKVDDVLAGNMALLELLLTPQVQQQDGSFVGLEQLVQIFGCYFRRFFVSFAGKSLCFFSVVTLLD